MKNAVLPQGYAAWPELKYRDNTDTFIQSFEVIPYYYYCFFNQNRQCQNVTSQFIPNNISGTRNVSAKSVTHKISGRTMKYN